MANIGARKVEILEYGRMKLEKPIVLVGFPEVGLVGTIGVSYLIQKLALQEIGHVESSLEPAVIVVQRGEPRFPIRLFGRENLVAFLSDVPLTTRLSYELTTQIVKWSLHNKSSLMIGMTGIPSQDRAEMEGMPKVFAVSTPLRRGKKTNDDEEEEQKEGGLNFEKLGGIQAFDEGIIAGSYALLIKRCLALGQPNITLLAESHLQFPDPGAAASIINALNPFLSLNVDVKPLLDESEQIRLKMRELMNRTQQSMEQMSKQTPAPMVYT